MVQNWENFMSPSGGYYDDSMVTGLSGGLASFGIDMFMQPILDQNVRSLRAGYLGAYRKYSTQKAPIGSSFFGREGNILKGPRVKYQVEPDIDPSTGTSTKALRKQYGTEMSKQQFRENFYRNEAGNFRKQNIKKAASAAKFLRGVSWTLAITSTASMVEGMFTPGLTAKAAASDRMAFGEQGMMDTEQAYTQRQRALMAIHDSQLGIRNVIGNEAGHLHR